MEEIDKDLLIRHYGSLRRIQFDFRVRPADLPPITSEVKHAEWWYGPSGTGKSRCSRKEFPDAYLKAANTKWWCGYSGEDNVIIDDFDKSHDYMGYHLKIWCDMYVFLGEIKGQQNGVPIRPKKIIITSNYHPKDIWTDPMTLEPLLRRCKVVRFATFSSVVGVGCDEAIRWDAHNPNLDNEVGSSMSPFAPLLEEPKLDIETVTN